MSKAVLSIVPNERVCCKCKNSKPLTDYYRMKSDKDGHNRMCKSCQTGWHRDKLRNDPEWREKRYADRMEGYHKNGERKDRYAKSLKKYGITFKDVENALQSQLGLCANRGCGKTLSLDVRAGHVNRAVVDHCHRTGKFRAMLCNRCNILAGQVESDANLTLGIMEYLNKFKE